MNGLLRVLVFFAALIAFGAPAESAVSVKPLAISDGRNILIIEGTFEFSDDVSTLADEVRASRPTFVLFNSGGGNVDAAMRFGRAIRQLGLATLQLRSSECASACALAFLGGTRRIAEPGSIGVHRSSFSSDVPMETQDAVSAVQHLTAETIGYMIEMGIDPALLQLSLSIDSTDIRYLTASEMRQFRVITDDTSGLTTSISPDTPAAGYAPSSPTSSPSIVMPALSGEPSKPNRMAVYAGLDFVGRDIGNLSVIDPGACATECLTMNSCKAFTFNTKTRRERGPNCFLKSGRGQLDGNSVAVSGLLLGLAEPDAEVMTFGAIDPERHLYKDIDSPGLDLSRRPHPDAHTQFDCRLACINEHSCAAFTYVSKKKECWLKNGIGKARTLIGAITGTKAAMTYTPEIIPLR